MTFSSHFPREGLVNIDSIALINSGGKFPNNIPLYFPCYTHPQGKEKENKTKRNNKNENCLLITYFLPELKIPGWKEMSKK